MSKQKSLSGKIVRLISVLLIAQILVLSVFNSVQAYRTHKKMVFSALSKEVSSQKKTIDAFFKEITHDLSLINHQLSSLSFKEDMNDDSSILVDDVLKSNSYKSLFEFDESLGVWKSLSTSDLSIAKKGMLNISSIKGVNRLNFGEVFSDGKSLNQFVYLKNEYNKGIALELDLTELLSELTASIEDYGNTTDVLLFQTLKNEHVSFFVSSNPELYNVKLDEFFIIDSDLFGKETLGQTILQNKSKQDVILSWIAVPNLNWHLFFKVNQLEVFTPVLKQIFTTITLSLIGLVVLILITFIYTKRITKPIVKLAEVLKEMAKGNSFDFHLDYVKEDEVGQMVKSASELYTSQLNLIEFSKSIAAGSFNQDNSLKGELGEALLLMSENLKVSREEDQRRDWINSGMASFASVLRNTDQTDTQFFYNTIVSSVVKYVGLNQGTLYLLKFDSESPDSWYLEQAATYAYDRIKTQTKRFNYGEGVISEAVLQKELIYLTEVPQNYVSITSGLGEVTPDVIVLVPLNYKDEIVGVLEVAGFKAVESFKKEYLRQVAESFASVIIANQVKIRTNQLLEEANRQTEQLKQQEEEMQQTMEEMQVNQEKLLANEEENQDLLEKLKNKEKEMEKKWMVHESELNTVMESIMSDLTAAQNTDKENKVIANYYQQAFERLDILFLVFEEGTPLTPKFATVNSEKIIGYAPEILTSEGFNYSELLTAEQEVLDKRVAFLEATIEGELETHYTLGLTDGAQIAIQETLYMIPGGRRKKALVIAKINRV
jgi:HAMP domain-containing protein